MKALFYLQARRLRHDLRRLAYTLRHGTLSQSPIFFANSFPKSGTHLLTQVMEGFARIGPAIDSGLPAVVTFDGFTGRRRTGDEILSDLNRFHPGDIGYGHVHAFAEAVKLLCEPRWATFFILRDPRDVVVSHVHYVAEMAKNHIHYRYYHEVLPDFDARLRASITGVPLEELNRAANGKMTSEPLPNIRNRFEPYLGWLAQPEVLVLRYEDLITNRRAALECVLQHAVSRGFRLQVCREDALQALEAGIDPTRSPTFRSGKIGGWKTSFTEEHRELFRTTAGDLLKELGYQ